jgi:hypothetical protein
MSSCVAVAAAGRPVRFLGGGGIAMVGKVLLSLMTFLTALTFLLSLLAISLGAIPS